MTAADSVRHLSTITQTNNPCMSNPNLTCPFAVTTVCFVAYVVKADFDSCADSSAPVKQHVIHYRFESPNPFSARAGALREVRRIKSKLDRGLVDPDTKYQYQGIRLWLEYQISQPCSDTATEIKRTYLLDGNIGTRDNVLQRLSNEEFLLDVMGFSFVRGISDGDDGQDYSEMVDKLFNGLMEIKTN